MKLHIKTISVVTTAGLLFTLMSSIPVNASTNIAVSSANFPDQEFREYVYEYCDGNHNGFLTQEEIDEVDTISVYDTNIKDLTGIGYFTKLEYLNCFNNQLTTLDTSNNKNLTFIDCSGNNLTSINVKANTKLQYLACYDNNLKSLDISGNPSLMYLEAQNNQIATLNISNNNNLLMAYKYGDTFDCDETVLDTIMVKKAVVCFLSIKRLKSSRPKTASSYPVLHMSRMSATRQLLLMTEFLNLEHAAEASEWNP